MPIRDSGGTSGLHQASSSMRRTWRHPSGCRALAAPQGERSILWYRSLLPYHTPDMCECSFTVILASTLIIWFVSHFAWNFEYLPDERMNESMLAGIGMFISPIFTPLGFGVQLGSFGWIFAVCAITGLIAKENVVATFGTLAACLLGTATPEILTETYAIEFVISTTGISWQALLAFITFNMLTIPCFATCATVKGELRTSKFITTLLFWIFTSFVVSSSIYLILTWYWTLFIILGVLALVVIGVILFNKFKPLEREN